MDYLKVLLAILLVLTAYFGLMRVLAGVLRTNEFSQHCLAWAYWGGSSLVLACWLAYTCGGWIPRFPVLFIVAFVGSGWLAGVRARLGVASAGLRTWLMVHSWCCLPAALLLALGWAFVIDYEPVYRDDSMAVELADDTPLFSDDRAWKLTFYQSRSELFEVALGETRTHVIPGPGPEFWREEWWRDVEAVTPDAQAQTVTIRKCCGQLPLRLKYQQP